MKKPHAEMPEQAKKYFYLLQRKRKLIKKLGAEKRLLLQLIETHIKDKEVIDKAYEICSRSDSEVYTQLGEK